MREVRVEHDIWATQTTKKKSNSSMCRNYGVMVNSKILSSNMSNIILAEEIQAIGSPTAAVGVNANTVESPAEQEKEESKRFLKSVTCQNCHKNIVSCNRVCFVDVLALIAKAIV